MAEFFYRLNLLSEEEIGLDRRFALARLEPTEQAEVARILREYQPDPRDEVEKNRRRPLVCFVVTVNGRPEPLYVLNHAVRRRKGFGRATRAFFAWNKETSQMMFYKDGWRALQMLGYSPEATTLLRLADVEHIPRVAAGGDILNQVTVNTDYIFASWNKNVPRDQIRPEVTPRLRFSHSCLLVHDIGYRLCNLRSSQHLLQATRDAFEGMVFFT
jgi:hypothetical protein